MASKSHVNAPFGRIVIPDVKLVKYSGVSNLANSNLAISLFSDSLDTGKNLDLAILSRI